MSNKVSPKVLFLNLTSFTQAGGIEKFNKCFLKALSELENERFLHSDSISAYDDKADVKYYPESKYKGFNRKRLLFVIGCVLNARKYDQIIIGHINMAIVPVLIKKLFPKKKIILITHGIEVWEPLEGNKKKVLHNADLILSVSSFTKQKIVDVQSVDSDKIKLFPNTIDPYFPVPKQFEKDLVLRSRYGFDDKDQVMFTLARLSSNEQYKGYDIVLKCLPSLIKEFPRLRYAIAGKADAGELTRVIGIIEELGIQDNVRLIGFIKEEELIAHYLMNDVYIMPSKGEGFGIVFIEAMVCGLPVIAGNQDGSVDALVNGELGTLVNPDNSDQVSSAIRNAMLSFKDVSQKQELQQKTLQYFGFPAYKQRLKEILL